MKPAVERRRCTAHARSGERCRRAPIQGATVCKMHGGGAPQVVRKAAERLADLIDPDRALREAARIAYSDIRELYDEYGRILPVQQWPDHVAAAVSSIEVRSAENGSAISARVKFWDKTPALALLFKRLGLLEPAALPDRPRTPLVFVVERHDSHPPIDQTVLKDGKWQPIDPKDAAKVAAAAQQGVLTGATAEAILMPGGTAKGSETVSKANGNGSRPKAYDIPDDIPDFTRRGGD